MKRFIIVNFVLLVYFSDWKFVCKIYNEISSYILQLTKHNSCIFLENNHSNENSFKEISNKLHRNKHFLLYTVNYYPLAFLSNSILTFSFFILFQQSRDSTCTDVITGRKLSFLEIFPEDLLCHASALSSKSVLIFTTTSLRISLLLNTIIVLFVSYRFYY